MENTNIDTTDRSILKALQLNGRLSIQELSDKVALSPSPCSRRVKILEEKDIIQGYRALIDETKIGYGFSIFVSVQLDKQIDEAMRTFEGEIVSYPEVVDCWLMTGNRDYLMRIAVGGLSDYETFLTNKLTKIPGVASIESSIPIRSVKSGFSREA